MRLCKDNCIFLNPKEKNQTEFKEPHVCRLFGRIIKHSGFHPSLVAIEGCFFAKKIININGNNYIHRIKEK